MGYEVCGLHTSDLLQRYKADKCSGLAARYLIAGKIGEKTPAQNHGSVSVGLCQSLTYSGCICIRKRACFPSPALSSAYVNLYIIIRFYPILSGRMRGLLGDF